jgi:hypothetical protein
MQMNLGLTEIIITYIDEALDIDDLENLGDEVRSLMTTAGIPDWQVSDVLRTIHAELCTLQAQETDRLRLARIRAAVSCIEAEYADFIIIKETESLPE